MYDNGDNKRKAEIRNPSMLAYASFGSVEKDKMITEPSHGHAEQNNTAIPIWVIL